MAKSQENTQNVVVNKHVAVLPRISPKGLKSTISASLFGAYQELFRVIFQIPNESVKMRVLYASVAALNGESPESRAKSSSSQCSHCVATERIDCSTQTTTDEEESQEVAEEVQRSSIHSIGGVVKVGRRRKVLTPTASAGILGVRLTERQKLLRQIEVQERPAAVRTSERLPSQTDSSHLSRVIEEGIECHPNEIANMLLDLEQPTVNPADVNRKVKELMFMDWVECEKFNDHGYLPIHVAVMNSEETYLRRQCITLNFRKLGVDLESSGGRTALQIGLLCSAEFHIIDILLKYGANVAQVDRDGNNCVLLAAKFAKDIEIFTAVLRKISLEELQRENFSGQGIFRIVVDSGKLHFLCELIKYVDECLGLPPSMPKCPRKGEEKTFIHQCQEKLAKFTEEDAVKCIKINNLKAKMINQRDKMAGKTPLFCAVEKQKESIMLALLMNFADPRVKTFAGVDAYAVANEILMNKKMSVPLFAVLVILENFNSCENQEDKKDIPKSKKNSRKSSAEAEETITGKKRRKTAR